MTLRNRHFLLFDAIGFLAAPFLAGLIRFESFGWPAPVAESIITFSLLAVPVRLIIARAMGLYSALWQHASISELERILVTAMLSAGATGVLGVAVDWWMPGEGRMPWSILALDALLATAVLAGPRLLARVLSQRPSATQATHVNAIAVGAGSAGELVARELRGSTRSHCQIVAFVDDDPEKLGKYLHGIRVEGRVNDLPRLIRLHGAKEVVLAIPSARGGTVRRIVEMAQSAGAMVRTVPRVPDLLSGRVTVSQLRPVEIQDLLRRDPITTDVRIVREQIEGHVVLVTGAGGSIGSELCRQIAELRPSLLVALDHSENQIFEIENEIRERRRDLKLAPVIADIRDASRIARVFERYRPTTVFHAAAHKHVPLMEENVAEAVTNNVLGTRNVVEMALEFGTQHFVLISTDKAVRPTSIMGATKQIAELIVRRAAARAERHFVAVRFGNVLGSRGSVIPTFLRQIAAGGPITITHPEIRRYFMTIPEAVQLVLQAGALGEGGELFVLDMGEPVKIVDLARDLLRLSGLEEGEDIEIKFTGLRPGEKLYEEVLFGDEDVRQTAHPKVIRVIASDPPTEIEGRIDELIRMVTLGPAEDAKLRQAIIELVPDFILPNKAGLLPFEGEPRRRQGS